MKLVFVEGEYRLNGWLKYKAEREALVQKEAKRAARVALSPSREVARVARIAKREADKAARAEAMERVRAAKRLAKQEAQNTKETLRRANAREARDARKLWRVDAKALERRATDVAQQKSKASPCKAPPPKPMVPPDLLTLAAVGHLPGFVSVNPHSFIHEPRYADTLEGRYLLHLPEGTELEEVFCGLTSLYDMFTKPDENILEEW